MSDETPTKDPSDVDASLPELPTVVCPHCEEIVPAGHFCGNCGAHLLQAHTRGSATRRLHSYAAFPDEPIYRLSVASSLFPHLSHHSRNAFRIALGWLGFVLVVLAIFKLESPLIAVAAVGIPLLFQLYIVEAGPYEDEVILPMLVTVLVGAGLGVGWAQIGGPYVQRDLLPVLQPSLTTQGAFAAAVLVPAIGQLLMFVPVVVMRVWKHTSESLDGFVVAASGALGFTAAATIAELSSQLHFGIVAHRPFSDIISQALVRGISVPLVAALGTGVFGATIWMHRRTDDSRTSAGGLWATSPLLAFAAALVVQIGLGYTDIARLQQAVQVVVHLLAVVVMIAFLRFVIHHVLLHEHHDFVVGPALVCPSCHHMVPTMPFCPQCGVARHATARSHRRRELVHEAERAQAVSTGAQEE
jgi:hypothetical protein